MVIRSTRLQYTLICSQDQPSNLSSFAVINLCGVSTNKNIICFIAMQTYKELKKIGTHCIHVACHLKPYDALTLILQSYYLISFFYFRDQSGTLFTNWFSELRKELANFATMFGTFVVKVL
jgi:lauroyl/myristoyl acyltransferase